MKRIGIIEENKRTKPAQCSMSAPADRNNNADQARTPAWQSSALRRRRTPARAGGVEREAAVVAGGRKRERLYFPVNSDDAIAIAAVQAAADGNAPECDACISLLIPPDDASARAACISLLISATGRSGLRPKRPGDDGLERGGLHFPANWRNDSLAATRMRALADRSRFRRMRTASSRIAIVKACRSLLTRTPPRSAHLPALRLFCCAK